MADAYGLQYQHAYFPDVGLNRGSASRWNGVIKTINERITGGTAVPAGDFLYVGGSHLPFGCVVLGCEIMGVTAVGGLSLVLEWQFDETLHPGGGWEALTAATNVAAGNIYFQSPLQGTTGDNPTWPYEIVAPGYNQKIWTGKLRLNPSGVTIPALYEGRIVVYYMEV